MPRSSTVEKTGGKYFTPNRVKRKARMMRCTYNGCENTFVAFPHARFCEYHKDPSTRPVERKPEEKTMFEFKHSFNERTIIERACDCCKTQYRIEVTPGRVDYPRFCEEHHSEYKRINWRQANGKK